MLSTTDDLRIVELKELSTPEDVMREIPRTLTATRVVTSSGPEFHRYRDKDPWSGRGALCGRNDVSIVRFRRRT